METYWTRGCIRPKRSGEYFRLAKTLKDIESFYKAGKVILELVGYNADTKMWDDEPNENFWEILAWAEIELPDIPNPLKGQTIKCDVYGYEHEMEVK